jgi:hypothetical protein
LLGVSVGDVPSEESPTRSLIERRAKASDRATHRDFVTHKNPSPLIEISICTLKDGVL